MEFLSVDSCKWVLITRLGCFEIVLLKNSFWLIPSILNLFANIIKDLKDLRCCRNWNRQRKVQSQRSNLSRLEWWPCWHHSPVLHNRNFKIITHFAQFPPTIIVRVPTVIDPWLFRPLFKSSNGAHWSFRNSATRFWVNWPPIMYAAWGVLAVEYCEIRLNKVVILRRNIVRLTLNRTENQDHRTISKYLNRKSPSWTNSLNNYQHIRW